jgi:hypothetical protein
VLTWHNDNARTGGNLKETILTPSNVNSSTFGKVLSYQVDGQIYAQPLYAPNLKIPNAGTHNVVFVATENDSLYAFDADGLVAAPLWRVSFIDPVHGVTTIPCATKSACPIYPQIGITGTPVISIGQNAIYVVVRTLENGAYFDRLHALDIRSGVEKFGGPVVIQGSVPGSGAGSSHGTVSFNPKYGNQRPGLLLVNGTIYIGFAGLHGWVMGYSATTLQQTAIFSTSPNASGAGIWQAGGGLAADGAGNIYAAVGNGTFDANTGGTDYGDTLLKLNAGLAVADYFTPMDQNCRGTNDRDLGSGGPLLLPTQTGAVPNELIIGGKGGPPCDTGSAPIYLLNRGNLGKYHSAQDHDVQTIEGSGVGESASLAYWQGPTAAYIYQSGQAAAQAVGDHLKQYAVTGGLLSATPTAQTTNVFPIGSTPAISSNGSTNGIVWALERDDNFSVAPGSHPAILRAYDATNVATELYDSTQASGNRDGAGAAIKFAVPTIVNGRVYVGTQTELDVYGLLGPSASVSVAGLTFASQAVGSSSQPQTVTFVNTGAQSITLNSVTITGAAKAFSETNNCGAPVVLAAGATCTASVVFHPVATGAATAALKFTDTAGGSPQSVTLTGNGH